MTQRDSETDAILPMEAASVIGVGSRAVLLPVTCREGLPAWRVRFLRSPYHYRSRGRKVLDDPRIMHALGAAHKHRLALGTSDVPGAVACLEEDVVAYVSGRCVAMFRCVLDATAAGLASAASEQPSTQPSATDGEQLMSRHAAAVLQH
jgi:hypothetical protein